VHNSRHPCGIVARTLPAAPRTTLLSLAALLGCAGLAGLGAWLIDQPVMVGGAEDLLPVEHRSPTGSHLRLVLRGPAAADNWPQIVDQLGPQLPGHFPLAPPPTEARGWLDAHILYRIAPTEHAALAARLEPAAMRAAVAGIRARLASPLFGVGDEQPRRDPLGLRALAAAEPGFLGSARTRFSRLRRTRLSRLRPNQVFSAPPNQVFSALAPGPCRRRPATCCPRTDVRC
jgi:hypothetical protein